MREKLWKIRKTAKSIGKLNNPILIEGLPGLGNVGKIAADFIVDKLNAKKIYDISSFTFPHSVFVNEDNLVELPSIEIYLLKRKGISKKKGLYSSDLLFLVGDVQPIDEYSCYSFCSEILELFKKLNGKEIITLGGIGLQELSAKPKLYCTGNSHKIVEKYKTGTQMLDRVYGIVGPIVGVSGVLLGLAKEKKIMAISILAETIGHPMYLGIKGAREIVKVLIKKLGLDITIKDMDKEIKSLEAEILKKTKEIDELTKESALKKLRSKLGDEISYIG